MDGQRDDDAPDLAGLQPRYTWSTGRGLRIALLVLMTLLAITAVLRLVDERDTVDIVLSIIQLLTFVVFLGAYFIWTPATFLEAEGVRLQNGFPGVLVIPWSRVRDVQVQDRWQQVSRLTLKDGRSKPLIGLPAEDAQRLADALAARAMR